MRQIVIIACVLISLAAALMMVMSPRAPLPTPAVFADKTLREAKRALSNDGRLLVVDAWANWCTPCREMRESTWVAPNVDAWFKQNASAIELDIDAQADLAQELRIMSIPTIIVYRWGADGAVEAGRKSGYQTAEELVGWLETLRTTR
jgi:thioredoxin 1